MYTHLYITANLLTSDEKFERTRISEIATTELVPKTNRPVLKIEVYSSGKSVFVAVNDKKVGYSIDPFCGYAYRHLRGRPKNPRLYTPCSKIVVRDKIKSQLGTPEREFG